MDRVIRFEFMASYECCEAGINRIHSTICVSGLRLVLERCHSLYLQYQWLRLPSLQKRSCDGYDVNNTLNATAKFNSRNVKKNIVEDLSNVWNIDTAL